MKLLKSVEISQIRGGSINIETIMTARTKRSFLTRTIIVIGVIACLCFSVGEGLRLRPFPVSTVESGLNISYEASARPYGPLDVPTRVQTRSKRQAADYAVPPFQNTQAPTIHCVPFFAWGELVAIASTQVGSIPPGRAPPAIS